MKALQKFNKWFYRLYLPLFGCKDVIYTVQGGDWYAFYASDTKRWVLVKREDFNGL